MLPIYTNPRRKRKTGMKGKGKKCDTLEEVLGRVVNVLVGKGCNEVVRVIVVWLVVDLDLF